MVAAPRAGAWRLAVSTPRAVLAGLALVLIVGGWLRLSGLDWDERQHLHPDERFLTMVVTAEQWPRSLGEYLDGTRSPLNPRNVGFAYFPYGTLPTTLVKGLGILSGRTRYDEVPQVGRLASAVADLGTLIFAVLLARRLYGDSRIALLTGALYAVSVLPIQHAHFFVVDTFATCFITAALWAMSGTRRGDLLSYAITGVLFGLALSCKLSVAPFAAVVAVVALRTEGVRAWRGAALRLALAGLVTLLVLRLFHPDAFAGPGLFGLAPSPRWLENLVQTSRLMSGAVDFPPGVQWANRPAVLFSLDNLVTWNLGPFLGVTVCAAVLAAAWRLAVAGEHRVAGERGGGMLLLWTALVFVPQSAQFVKAGRYLLPIYPALSILAAWLLVRVRDASRRGGRSSWPRIASAALVSVVCLGTFLWAVAFTSIYRRPNTRVAASRWIYENVLPGSVVATEYWDDALPLRLGPAGPERYRSIALRHYDDETPSKLSVLVTALESADYVVLASNRLYDSIPRLPMRYPMTTRYYRALFAGKLGFERAADFTSYPSLGPIEFPDQAAEEAFSVYDHARVQIFRKTARWNAADAMRVLNDGIDWEGIVRLPAARAAGFHNDQLLSTEAFADARRGGTWSRLFDPASFVNRFPVLPWCLAVELLGLAAFPIAARVFRELPDRGWLISKLVGLLLVSYLAWLAASLRWMTFSRSTLASAVVVVAGVALWELRRRRSDHERIWRHRGALLLGEEVFFWATFAGLLLLRSGNPDLWHPVFGGEKPMDFAYLNAVVRSEYFPPYNPWFAGGYINYYYFGFVLVAALIKLTGVVPQVAYNLAIPTFHALTAAGAFTVGFALASELAPRTGRGAQTAWPWASGLLAAVAVAVLGNLVELRLLVQHSLAAAPPSWPGSAWYWNATRVIPHWPGEAPPITEFPFFTFLYGDLHAHFLALPLTLVALALVVTLVLAKAGQHGSRVRWTTLLLLGFVLGALYATNTWDYPTYLALAAAGLALRQWRPPAPESAGGLGCGSWRAPERAREPGRVVWVTAVRVLLIVLAGRVLFAPFFSHYNQPYGRIELWTGSRTPLDAFLWIHGLFVFVLATTFAAWVGDRRRAPAPGPITAPMLLLGVLVAAGLLLSVAVEIVVMAGDVGRMNTVFKFYFQVWVLWGVAAALSATLAVAHWRASLARRPAERAALYAWAGAALVLAAACAAYPVLAMPARWRDRFDVSTGFGLDGQAYMRTARHTEFQQTFALAPDLDAIHWLQQHLEGTPVIVEAHTPEYHWGGRISSNTGLPTILGWSWHQAQQRDALPPGAVERRAADVDAIYRDVSPDRARVLLDRYRVDYVYVGALERRMYPSEGLDKFDADADRWQRVYRNQEVSIYRVRR